MNRVRENAQILREIYLTHTNAAEVTGLGLLTRRVKVCPGIAQNAETVSVGPVKSAQTCPPIGRLPKVLSR